MFLEKLLSTSLTSKPWLWTLHMCILQSLVCRDAKQLVNGLTMDIKCSFTCWTTQNSFYFIRSICMSLGKLSEYFGKGKLIKQYSLPKLPLIQNNALEVDHSSQYIKVIEKLFLFYMKFTSCFLGYPNLIPSHRELLLSDCYIIYNSSPIQFW